MYRQRSLMANFPLFIVLFIDSMGLGLLFPILNSLIIDPVSTFLPTMTSIPMRDFLYGLTVGIFMLSWFFGATILGDLSDTIGRKRALIICLVGSFIGYFISAVAIFFHSLTVLIIGRVIAGFTAGSQPIAQAAIVDISSPEVKARNIGLILLAISLGFVFGPIFGGILSDPHLVSWFAFSTPLYFAAIISLLNALLLWYTFKETFHITRKISIKLHHSIKVFVSAFQHKKIRYLSLVLLVMILGWSDFFTFMSMFVFHRYHFTPLKVSFFMAALGLGFTIGCGYLVGFFSQRYTLKNCVIVGLLLSAISVLVFLLVNNVIVACFSVIFIGMALGVAYSTLLTMFSNQVNENEQGWVMGVTGSIMALCFGVNALLTGVIIRYGGANLPIALAIVGLGISGLLMWFYRPKS